MVRLLLPGSLLMKTKEENEAVEAETLWLAEKRKTMEDGKELTVTTWGKGDAFRAGPYNGMLDLIHVYVFSGRRWLS
ncbi:hypothetical protein AAG906_036216 [Vitis piasezkii]